MEKRLILHKANNIRCWLGWNPLCRQPVGLCRDTLLTAHTLSRVSLCLLVSFFFYCFFFPLVLYVFCVCCVLLNHCAVKAAESVCFVFDWAQVYLNINVWIEFKVCKPHILSCFVKYHELLSNSCKEHFLLKNSVGVDFKFWVLKKKLLHSFYCFISVKLNQSVVTVWRLKC